MQRSILALATAAGLAFAPAAASATTYLVDAQNNSSSGGTGLLTVSLVSGQAFTVSVDPKEIWNAGALPRWSNADGLITDLTATGTDASGEAAGTQIGSVFPLYTASGLTAPYGALVGSINGVYKLLGTNFSGPAWSSGDLYLYYWDSNNEDNSESIAVELSAAAVPEPGTWALMLVGFAVVGFGLRRRTAATTKVSYSFS